MKKEIDFIWNNQPEEIVKRIINSDVRLFMANEAKRLMDQYVPAKNLILAQAVRIYIEGEQGIVHYNSPHAHYQYKGELYVSSVTGSPWASKGEYKIPTGEPLNHSKFRHPLATSEWDKAMMRSRKGDLVSATQNYINRGG